MCSFECLFFGGTGPCDRLLQSRRCACRPARYNGSDRRLYPSHCDQSINPRYAYAYCNRELVYRDLQRYREALADLNRAIELGLEQAIPDRDEVLRLIEQQP